MRHTQLRAFHHVALAGGFSRAAEALNVSQPSISEQVRRLEQAHDVLLFHRERNNVRPTPAGEALLRLTRQYFDAEQRIAALLTESSAALAGELRIIVDAAPHVTAILGAFRRRHPGVRISLRQGNSDAILAALRAYEAEIGVIGSVETGTDMTALDLGTAPVIAFARRGYLRGRTAVRLADLAGHPLIFRERGSRTRRLLEDAAKAQGIRFQPAITAEGREAVREVVASGAGIGFVSRAEYVPDPRLVALTLSGVDLRMTETMIHLTERRDVGAIGAFWEIARARAGRAG